MVNLNVSRGPSIIALSTLTILMVSDYDKRVPYRWQYDLRDSLIDEPEI